MSLLDIQDLQKVNQFFRQINQNYTDFVNNALNTLQSLFGYRLTSYIVFDKKSDGALYVSEIGSTSVNLEVLERYRDHFFRHDVFLTQFRKHSHTGRSNYFFTVSDFMSNEAFESTTFGSFLADYRLNYYACITTGAISNYPIYSLNIHKTKDEGDFSPRELELLELISQVFIESYYLYMQHQSLRYSIKLTKQFTNTLDYGFAIMDAQKHIVCNNTTYIFFASIITNTKDIFSINETLLKLIEERLGHSILDVQSDTILQFDPYHIKLVPNTAVTNRSVDCHVYINIYDTTISSPTSPMFKEASVTQTALGIGEKEKFTNRECEIIELMLQGCNNQDIANKLYISIFTVKTHIKNIFNKLDVSTRMAAIAKLSDLK